MEERRISWSRYRGIDPRRRQEVADSRMIYEDCDDVANLPDEPIYHEFNASRYVEKFRPGYDEIVMKIED